MPMERPTYFKKVLQTLRQLSTSKGFSIRQIAEHLLRLGIRRDPKDIRTIVEQSVKYGVKNKLVQERCGKFHLTAARLQTPVQSAAQSAAEKKKKKRVRFKKGKTNINDALRRAKSRKKRKTSKGRSKGQKSKRRPSKSKQETPVPSECGETTSQERSPNNSKSELIVERESKEALNVTPDKDVHGNCVNKNRDRSKQPSNVREPPELEPETEIGWQPPRPPTKLSRRSTSRHSSKLRKDFPYKCKHSHSHKCKHSHQHLKEQRKRLRDYIPDDKTFRDYKTRSRRHHDKSEESSHCNCNFQERKCRKCHSHYCTCRSKRHCCHQRRRHYNSDSQLERKTSKTNLDQLDKTVLDPVVENLSPFEVFLEANHTELETIVENIGVEDEQAEEVEAYSPSYIN